MLEARHARPRLKTVLPGPNAARVLQQDAASLSQGGLRPYRFVMREGYGCWAEDVDDNVFLDFTSGIGVLATGHCHPKVLQAIREQSGRFIHISSAYHTYDVMVRVADRIARSVAVRQPGRVFFANSGTEAIEGAVKLARWYTQRPYVVSFFGAFHGRTLGALSVSGLNSDQRRRVGPLLPGVFHLPYPDRAGGLRSNDVFARARELFDRVVPPDEIAAVLVEAIQGGAGPMAIPDDDFLPRLRQLADQHGFVIVIDEVYTGVGRTGTMWAHQHWDAQPDIVCFAKSIASGMPLGGFVAGAGVMEWPRGSHNSTFGGNPVCCAAAEATLDVVEDGLLENTRRRGAALLDELTTLGRKHASLVSRVSGKGLMLYVELKSAAIAQQVLETAFTNGLLLLAAGRQGVRLAPPLIVSEDETRIAAEILGRTLEAVGGT